MQTSVTRFCKLTVLTAAFVAASSGIANTTTANRAQFGAAWKSVDCKTFGVPALAAALSDCGYVTVPERHSKQDGRTIELGVVRTRSIGNNPAPDPLFVEQGGPGSTTIGVFVNQVLPSYTELPALLQSRDLIFVEERGTLHSKPFLSCPELNAHNIAVAKGERDPKDIGWIEACNKRSIAQGINTSAFNTRENAADIYFVAQVLGYEEFNYYGVSYGTLLGQYVMAQADEHKPKLRSVLIDGVVRPDIDFNLAVGHTMSYALRNLFADCAKDVKCNRAYPDLEKKFLSLVDRLNQQPIPITLTIPSSQKTIASKLDGDKFLRGILPYLYQSALSRFLPSRIDAATKGNIRWVEENLSEGLEDKDAKEMYHTVLCARTSSIRVKPSSLFPPPYPQLVVLAEEANDQICKILQVEQQKPFAYKNTEIPTLVFNGTYDPVTPQPYGEAVASNLKNAYVYTFPGVGHGALFSPPDMPAADCATQIARDFLTNPKQKPDSSCLSQVKPIFVTN